MDIDAILAAIAAKVPVVGVVLMILGSLVVIMSAYILATPNKEDDAWFEKVKQIPVLGVLITALERFSLFVRK